MKHLLLVLSVLLSVSLYAQQGQWQIKGMVVEHGSGKAIPYAQAVLLNQGKIITGTLTDTNGVFILSPERAGNYDLAVSFLGFTTDTSHIEISSANGGISTLTISITPKSHELAEVEIIGQANAFTSQIDRQVYRPGDFETARTGTAVDILQKLPSVSVSPDMEISVRGTSGFMVYLNGKPTQMDASVVLSQIPASAISSIEIITVPSAKFDAQGKAGIINIVTDGAEMKGTSFTAETSGGGIPWNTGFDPLRYGLGLKISQVNKKWTLYAGVNYKYRAVRGSRDGDARLLQADGSYYHMVANGDRPEWFPVFSAQTGVEYRPSKNTTVGAGYYFGHKIEGRTADYIYHNFFGDIYKNPIDGSENRYVFNPNTHERLGTFNSINLYFTSDISENTTLNINTLYEYSKLQDDLDNQDYFYDNTSQSRGALLKSYRQTDENPLNGYRISIDLARKFDNGMSLEAGLQPQYLSHEGIFSYDTLETTTEQWFDYKTFENNIELKRSIYAAYLNLTGNKGHFAYMAGLRGEYTDQALRIEQPDYLNIFGRETKPLHTVKQMDWFPSLHLSYTINEGNKLNLAASRRINRPQTKSLAPFLLRRHYEVYLVGDPSLKPEYVTTAELTYSTSLAGQNVNLTGFYRATDNAIFRVNTVYEEENVLIRSYTNAGNDKATGAELNTNLEFGSAVRLFVGAALYSYRIEGEIFEFGVDARSTNWNVKGNLNLKLSNSLKFNWDASVASATVTAQGEDEIVYVSNAALVFTPEKKSGITCTLAAYNLFNTNTKALLTKGYDKTGTEIFYQTTTYYNEGPVLELAFAYQLNKHPKTTKTQKTFGEEEF